MELNVTPASQPVSVPPRERAVVEQLSAAIGRTPPGELRDRLEEHLKYLTRGRSELDRAAYQLVFFGEIGTGKSSVLAVLSDLVLPPSGLRKPGADLERRSMFPTGAGRTTVCEVRIKCSHGPHRLSLTVEPLGSEEVGRELRLFLGLVLDRVSPASSSGVSRADAGIRTELSRWFAHAAGYRDTYDIDRGAGESCEIEMLLSHLLQTHSASRESVVDAAAQSFAERIRPTTRQRSRWTWDRDDEAARREFLATFTALNNGFQGDAPLPRVIEIGAPSLLPELDRAVGVPVDITLVDSRGLEGDIGQRPDILHLLGLRCTIPFLFSRFNKTPTDILPVLRALSGRDDTAAGLHERLVVLVFDQDEAGSVHGADCRGDHRRTATGRAIRRNAAAAQLRSSGFPDLAEALPWPRIQFFSPARTLRLRTNPTCDELEGDEVDDRASLVDAISSVIRQSRDASASNFATSLDLAEAFLASRGGDELLRGETAHRLDEAIVAVLKRAGVQYIDRRGVGGALWVVGPPGLAESAVAGLQKSGVLWAFVAERRRGPPGWWTKDAR